MKKFNLLLLLAIVAMSTTGIFAQSSKYPALDIPYKKFVLSNGLTVIIHEDHKVPIVAVNVWYHVGSKNEKPGKTGFAHLFEHLMFNGSENRNKDYFLDLENIGATNLNGTTNNDRTNYFQNVPLSAFDQVLWLESDRMGHLLGAIDQARLDEQRGVVQNEKRQGENEPYAIAEELITKATFPSHHPYSWTVIGSMEDLNAASLADVKEWFKTYYGAANAVIVLAGDIDTEDALNRVKKYFGDIPAGPPVAKHSRWVPKMTGIQRQVAQDRVPQTDLQLIWNVPGVFDRESEALDIFAEVLGQGKTSRLFKRLVYTEQLCSFVNSGNYSNQISGQFNINARLKPGVDANKVEKIVFEELNNLLKNGPTQEEIDLVKTKLYAAKVRSLERIGGFGGKSDILAESMVFGGTPDAWKTSLENYISFNINDIKEAANKWLTDGVYILRIDPFPEYKEDEKGVDRTKFPEAANSGKVNAPKFSKATLSNGAKLIVAERKGLPIINMTMLIKSGYAADSETLAGTASITANLLDEGAGTMDALTISSKLSNLGSNLGSFATLDYNNLSLSSLSNNFEASLDIFKEVLVNPSFPEKDFERIKKQQLIGIANEKNSPNSMALRVLPKFMFPKDHPYYNPLTGSGTESDLNKITLKEVKEYYKKWYQPNLATIVIVGDISIEEAKVKLEKALSTWKKGSTKAISISKSNVKFDNTLYLMDRPGSLQSLIFAGNLLPEVKTIDEYSFNIMNDIFGGQFTSRLNMNLREDKHWSYGVGAFPYRTQGQSPYLLFSPVQTDKTSESVAEMRKEMNLYINDKPANDEEVLKAKRNNQMALTGTWETNGGIGGYLSEMVRFNYEDDYLEKMFEELGNVNTNSVQKMAKTFIKPNELVWVIVGDRAKIEASLKSSGFKSIKIIDTEGNIIE